MPQAEFIAIDMYTYVACVEGPLGSATATNGPSYGNRCLCACSVKKKIIRVVVLWKDNRHGQDCNIVPKSIIRGFAWDSKTSAHQPPK